MRIGFVSHQSPWWRKQRLAAKFLKMRLEVIPTFIAGADAGG